MLVGVQAMNALRNTALHRLLWLLKKRLKQSWPRQNKGFLKVQAKCGWTQQRGSSARFGSLKPHEYFILGVGLHRQHLPLLWAYPCARDAPQSIAGYWERISGDWGSFSCFSPLLCYPAGHEQPVTTMLFLQRQGTVCKWLLGAGVCQHRAAAVGLRPLSPLQPPQVLQSTPSNTDCIAQSQPGKLLLNSLIFIQGEMVSVPGVTKLGDPDSSILHWLIMDSSHHASSCPRCWQSGKWRQLCSSYTTWGCVSLASVVSRQDQHYQLLQQSNKCWGREVKIVVLSQFD